MEKKYLALCRLKLIWILRKVSDCISRKIVLFSYKFHLILLGETKAVHFKDHISPARLHKCIGFGTYRTHWICVC